MICGVSPITGKYFLWLGVIFGILGENDGIQHLCDR